MSFPRDWDDRLDERDKLLIEVSEARCGGNFDELMEDLYQRLYSHPMYPALERRLIEDIERGETIRLYRDVDEFIRERIVDVKMLDTNHAL